MSHHHHAITAKGAPAAGGPYSHAVRSSGFLFLSGQVPIDASTGELIEGGIGDQTRQCLRNLDTVARAGGASLADAVRVGIYVTDISTLAQVNDAYAMFFNADPPARTTIGVTALPLGAEVEIDAIVALPD